MNDRNKIMRFFGLHPQNDVRHKFAFTLAEGATHVGNSNNKRKFAFTLAEVLVTLGIIGVVAVLTVPNVISSYQKKLYVTQLQKGYSQFQQIFDLAMADDEVEYLADTELMQSINGDHIGASDDQSAFSSKLGEYMKIQKACQPYDYDDGCHDIVYQSLFSHADSDRGGDLQIFTKDGMIYYFHNYFSKTPRALDENVCNKVKNKGGIICVSHFIGFITVPLSGLEIDVNGRKKPNKYGRDLFRFYIDEKGQLIPSGSPMAFGLSTDYRNKSDHSCDNPSLYGVGCAAKIIDDGWVMDY